MLFQQKIGISVGDFGAEKAFFWSERSLGASNILSSGVVIATGNKPSFSYAEVHVATLSHDTPYFPRTVTCYESWRDRDLSSKTEKLCRVGMIFSLGWQHAHETVLKLPSMPTGGVNHEKTFPLVVKAGWWRVGSTRKQPASIRTLDDSCSFLLFRHRWPSHAIQWRADRPIWCKDCNTLFQAKHQLRMLYSMSTRSSLFCQPFSINFKAKVADLRWPGASIVYN